ncbi:ANKRD50, partial [Symbiodinium sp. CCMP2456]
FATMIKKVRAWLLRFGSGFQRQVVAKALQEFATLWLEMFKQDVLPTKTVKVLALLTTAKSRVPARTHKKDIPDLWKNQVKVVLSSASSTEAPR